MDVFLFEGYVQLAVFFVLLVIKIFAFANALLYSAESYLAADKLNKPTWCILLGDRGRAPAAAVAAADRQPGDDDRVAGLPRRRPAGPRGPAPQVIGSGNISADSSVPS